MISSSGKRALPRYRVLAFRRVFARSAAYTGTTLARRAWPAAKRAVDIVAAAGLLLVIAPLLACIAVAIKFDSRGPVLHRVRRAGYRGRPFSMLKFRKMSHDALGGPLTADDDPRLTRVGAILTRTRLDELPQLWDVLRGRMSLIGPRPEDPLFVNFHAEQYNQILSVRPGITGMSQLAFAAEREILDDQDPISHYVDRILPQKVSLDSMYACTTHFRLDVSIMYWTIVAVILRRPVAVHRDTGRMNVRRRIGGPIAVGENATLEPAAAR